MVEDRIAALEERVARLKQRHAAPSDGRRRRPRQCGMTHRAPTRPDARLAPPADRARRLRCAPRAPPSRPSSRRRSARSATSRTSSAAACSPGSAASRCSPGSRSCSRSRSRAGGSARARAPRSPACSPPACSARACGCASARRQTEASLAAAAVGVAGLFGTLVVAGPVYHLVPVAARVRRRVRDRRRRHRAGDPLARAGDGLARAARRAVGADRARRVRRRRDGLPGARVRRDDPRAHPPALDHARRLRLPHDDAAVGHLCRVRHLLAGRADRLRRPQRRLRARPRVQPPRRRAGRDRPARRASSSTRSPSRCSASTRCSWPPSAGTPSTASRGSSASPSRTSRSASPLTHVTRDLARARADRPLDRRRARRHRVRVDRLRACRSCSAGPSRRSRSPPILGARSDKPSRADQARRRGPRPPGRRGRPPRRPHPRHGRPVRPDRARRLPEPRVQRAGRVARAARSPAPRRSPPPARSPSSPGPAGGSSNEQLRPWLDTLALAAVAQFTGLALEGAALAAALAAQALGLAEPRPPPRRPLRRVGGGRLRRAQPGCTRSARSRPRTR